MYTVVLYRDMSESQRHDSSYQPGGRAETWHESLTTSGCAGEFIKDTEEYINIELDSSRNRLIRLEIVLTAGTFAVAIWSLVGSAILPPIYLHVF